MLTQYLNNEQYDIENSYVIGDRITGYSTCQEPGVQRHLAEQRSANLGSGEISDKVAELDSVIALETTRWSAIYEYLRLGLRQVIHERNTSETQIKIELNIDGRGKAAIITGLGFFDHMLEQIARHGKMDLTIRTNGDLHIDEHHTIEDTGIALGEAFAKALADKRGMERYGFGAC